ncbi:pyruvate dehydrogenase complex dihydrolipoamide acetyltransferase [Acinetobacter rudis]|uniref:Acetyltransferase component of pyruvate dehydrogenase complex n=1 Tax=Acinetobacter rudis TaxID=632955 RepID=A0AAW8JA59_9GAMM|nr:pyruvate dehydrogenase complex dihydrolipoamide acetyltransferase [Acinetobacter rudis]MDQ8936041.1 pyruvate dehydrogenase complex dihydrolipoamide acetyltransferase [Acinetobacter rudis]MDQ9018304.1 pyruvate dehydrogenase complex dihydrolipoamide acetyltransferase [Acinetobacter rudis]
MSKLLHMPEVLANTTHATINKWLVAEGDQIVIGQCIAEVETDKAVVEMIAEEEGLISKLIAQEGEEVEVGAAIAQLNGDGQVDLTPSPAVEQTVDSTVVAQVATQKDVTAETVHSQTVERIFASPLAKRLAQQNQLDLAELNGSGPRGRIVKRDIELALEQAIAQVAASAASTTATTTPVATAVEYEEVALSNMRKTIARRLTESKSTVPHFYLNVQCHVDALLNIRQQINAVAKEKISVNDMIIKAVALASAQVPEMNACWAETAIHQYHHVDISVAVATEKGLFTPVIRQVENKSLSTIHREVAELAELAREGKLRPEQYQGGTFSISNLGMFGVSDFNAIINPPQAGILAVGAIKKQPIVVNDEVQVGSVLRCSLSADHRVIDGAVAATWLAAFQQHIEDPLKLLI